MTRGVLHTLLGADSAGGSAPVSYPYSLSITNPGAESGVGTPPSGWTNDTTNHPGSDLRAAITSDPTFAGTVGTVRTGTYMFRFSGNGSGNSCVAYQDVSLPSGAHTDVDAVEVVASFSAWMVSQANDPGAINLIARDGGGSVLATYEGVSSQGDDATWVQRWVTMKLPATTRSLRLVMRVDEETTPPDTNFDDLDCTLYRYTAALTLTNPGGESGSITGWTAETGTMVAVTGGGSGVPTARTGSYKFRMGASGSVKAYQDVAITDPGQQALIDAGKAFAWAGGYNAGFTTDRDEGRIQLECRSSGGVVLATLTSGWGDGIGNSTDQWGRIDVVGAIPANTRTIRYRLEGRRTGGTNCDAYFDDLELHLCEID
jgi:hypothetical protein